MRLALHHASLSSCSQKVRLVLAEKGLAYESVEIDLIGRWVEDNGLIDPWAILFGYAKCRIVARSAMQANVRFRRTVTGFACDAKLPDP